MKKTNSFEYQIAADMDSIMKSKEFDSMFSKTAMLRQAGKACDCKPGEKCPKCDDQHMADTNDAKKDKKDKEDMHDAKMCKKKEMDKDHECNDSCMADDFGADDEARAEDLIGGFNTAIAVALNSLSKVSEVLDEAGLEKTAALSLTLAHNILVEAKSKKLTKEEAKKLKDKQMAKDKAAKEKAKKKEQEEKDRQSAKDKAEKEKAKEKAEKEKAKK